MKPWIASACFFLCCVAFGQETPGRIAFEEASIKVSEPQPMNEMRMGMRADAGLMRYSNVSLKDCIRVAYRVKDFQVDGPDWMGSARFDIVAKLPAGSTQDQIPDMLQALLADRFKLTLHRDKKDHAIYALAAGKGGPKLKPAEVPTGDGAGPGAGSPGRGGGMPRGAMQIMMSPEGVHLKAPSATLAGLAEMVSRFSERPVVDMSGIEGQYDFDLVFSPENLRGIPGPPGGAVTRPGDGGHPSSEAAAEQGGTIAEAVQRYGLKLEPRKAPMDILTVDHIEKAPTEN